MECTTRQSQFLLLEHFLPGWEIWRFGVVHLVVFACVLKATTKKGRPLFFRKKVHPRENPGYAYGC